jgi:hypothetical protein
MPSSKWINQLKSRTRMRHNQVAVIRDMIGQVRRGEGVSELADIA